jgi:hypothetical protein
MPDQSPRLRSNRLRTAAYLALFACVFLIVGWSAFWFLAHRSALRELKTVLSLEAAQGRDWSCGEMTSGGYPFAIEIDCEHPAFRSTADGMAATVDLRRALIRAPLYTPKLVTIDLTGPAETVFESIPMRATVDWRALQLSSRGLPDRLDRLSIVGEGAEIETRPTDAPPSRVRIVAFQTHLRRASGAIGSPYNIAASFAGVESAALDLATGSQIPAVIAAIGSVTQADKALGGGLAEKLELWRASGGRVTINLLSLQKGALAIQAEGALGLDQGRRPDGKLDLRLQNAAGPAMNLATQLGLIEPNSLAATLFRALLEGAKTGGETRIGLAFENGALSVGPLKGVLLLPPLY